MSTIQFANLTDPELTAEAEWQLRNNETGMTLITQMELLKRFAEYSEGTRPYYKKIDRNQLELPL